MRILIGEGVVCFNQHKIRKLTQALQPITELSYLLYKEEQHELLHCTHTEVDKTIFEIMQIKYVELRKRSQCEVTPR